MPRIAMVAGVVAIVAAARALEAQRVLVTDLEVEVDDGPAEPVGQLRARHALSAVSLDENGLPSIVRAPLPR